MAARANDARQLVVWRFADGLRGHENQTDGLVSALSDRTRLSIHTVPTPRARRVNAMWRALLGTDTRNLPNPDLLVGAGNATHLPMLVARRRHGGQALVLMKPNFPMAWFDLVIAPVHDRLAPRANLLVTRGALSRVRPAQHKSPGEGLILIGGPEREHPWAPDMLEAQIAAIAQRHRDIQWCAASSRRTPTDFLPQLRTLKLANLDTVAVEDVNADWLPGKLATAATVWVTEDSVSMLYEALTAGAATGLLNMPRRGARESRRNLGGGLLAEGLVTAFEDWQQGRSLEPPTEPLDEAGRCADWILNEWKAHAR
ncbi:MAG: ELM1/GtrOC1 family putative glycosyltransferase [Gammaproteobacteria bacterium]|nr:MAG: ELM1/GtrOC1 family putative glycosyltransferase [Gammaproteobacteria bacterium]